MFHCRTKQKKQYIYFIRKGKSNIFKIGITIDKKSRIKVLQSGNECQLSYHRIFRIPHPLNRFKLEKQIHKYLKSYRLKGEWFELPDHFISSIEHIFRYHRNMRLMEKNIYNTYKDFPLTDL